MRKPSKPTILFTLAAFALAGAAAVNIAHTDEQTKRVSEVTQLENQIERFGDDLDSVKASTSAAKTAAAEYRRLISEQDAAFSDSTGFLK